MLITFKVFMLKNGIFDGFEFKTEAEFCLLYELAGASMLLAVASIHVPGKFQKCMSSPWRVVARQASGSTPWRVGSEWLQ